MKRRRHLLPGAMTCAFVAAVLSACSEVPVEVAPNDATPHERSFAEQLADVRAGKSKEIRVQQQPVGDEQLAQLVGLDNLERLNVEQGTFSDAGLAHLSELPNLTLLRFSSSHVSDAGMEHIARIESLRFLHLIQVPITDAALPTIEGMQQLESFYLDGGQATDAALSALIAARPDLHFHKDQLHLPNDPRQD